MNTAAQVLSTLHGHEGWVWDGDILATNEQYSAEFWFDGGTPRLEFDHFIAGHLELTAAEHDDPAAILREIDIEIARWLDERTEYAGCVDPDHGVGDHPCDNVLGKDAAALLRDTGTDYCAHTGCTSPVATGPYTGDTQYCPTHWGIADRNYRP